MSSIYHDLKIPRRVSVLGSVAFPAALISAAALRLVVLTSAGLRVLLPAVASGACGVVACDDLARLPQLVPLSLPRLVWKWCGCRGRWRDRFGLAVILSASGADLAAAGRMPAGSVRGLRWLLVLFRMLGGR